MSFLCHDLRLHQPCAVSIDGNIGGDGCDDGDNGGNGDGINIPTISTYMMGIFSTSPDCNRLYLAVPVHFW